MLTNCECSFSCCIARKPWPSVGAGCAVVLYSCVKNQLFHFIKHFLCLTVLWDKCPCHQLEGGKGVLWALCSSWSCRPHFPSDFSQCEAPTERTNPMVLLQQQRCYLSLLMAKYLCQRKFTADHLVLTINTVNMIYSMEISGSNRKDSVWQWMWSKTLILVLAKESTHCHLSCTEAEGDWRWCYHELPHLFPESRGLTPARACLNERHGVLLLPEGAELLQGLGGWTSTL